MNYWLLKSEPNCYSIQDLKNDKVEHWDGVRNYQARNFMKNDMKVGDLAFFYHSNCKPPHIAGICKVVKEAYPDHTAWDASNKHFDPKSTPDNPRWFMVDVEFVEEFENPISLEDLKENPNLGEMKVLQRGNRLSITPVKKSEFDEILGMR
jgi:predicted RNA-binding protein with PUA-like domain